MAIVLVTGSASAAGAIRTAVIPANRSLVMSRLPIRKRERAAAPLDRLTRGLGQPFAWLLRDLRRLRILHPPGEEPLRRAAHQLPLLVGPEREELLSLRGREDARETLDLDVGNSGWIARDLAEHAHRPPLANREAKLDFIQ